MQMFLNILEFVLNGLNKTQLHTYIIGHYNPSVRIIDIVSHTTYVVCVNLMHNYSQSFCQKSDERKSLKKYFLYFILMSFLGLEPWPTHCPHDFWTTASCKFLKISQMLDGCDNSRVRFIINIQ